MLSDLIQYFIKNDEHSFISSQDEPLTKMLKYVYSNSLNSKFCNLINNAIHNKKYELSDIAMFYADYFYSTNYHYQDIFDIDIDVDLPENIILEMLLSTVSNELSVRYEDNMLSEILYPKNFENNEKTENYNIQNFNETDFGDEINHIVKQIVSNMTDANGNVDSYTADTVNVCYGYIYSKNTELLNEIIASYNDNFYIKNAFKELGICLKNNLFYIAFAYSIEMDMIYEQLNIDIIIKGLDELRRKLNIKKTDKLNEDINNQFSELNNLILENGGSLYSIALDSFVKIMTDNIERMVYPVEGEIIL